MKFELEEYHRNTSNEELINDLRIVSQKLNKDTLIRSEYNKYGKYSATTISKRFGSWNNAIEEAKLQKFVIRNFSKEDLFKNIENVWITLGRQPKYVEMKKPLSKWSNVTYDNKFGTWRKALEEFVKYINEDSDETVGKVESTETTITGNSNIVHKTRREISERMRFRILMRDGFTCKKCGRSPLKSLDVELHIDHIIPWSKGGESVENNLETKCEKCNLGKGNAFEI